MFERLSAISERARLGIMGLTALVILVLVNLQIASKQDIVENGDTLLLKLAPRDPRSLLQGDYMALRYAIADQVAQAAEAAGVKDGRIIVERAPNGEARFVGLYRGGQPGQGRHLLRFRRRGDSVRLASDAYFFEEGQWKTYAGADYGELRVDPEGDAVLVALRDGEGRRLEPALQFNDFGRAQR